MWRKTGKLWTQLANERNFTVFKGLTPVINNKPEKMNANDIKLSRSPLYSWWHQLKWIKVLDELWQLCKVLADIQMNLLLQGSTESPKGSKNKHLKLWTTFSFKTPQHQEGSNKETKCCCWRDCPGSTLMNPQLVQTEHLISNTWIYRRLFAVKIQIEYPDSFHIL